MDFVYILLLSAALAMDCFTMSVCISSISGVRLRDYFLIPLHFAAFHFGMAMLGYYVGVFFRKIIQNVDHWVAFILLTAIGIKIIIDSLKNEKNAKRPTTEGRLILLSLATSVDALVIGITFAFTGIEIELSSAILASVVFIISLSGLFLGEKIHKLKLKYIGVLGGIVLVAIGLKTLLSHVI